MSRLKLLALIGLVLFVLSRVQVHVLLVGPVPVLAVAEFAVACAEAALLAVAAAGITRSLRGAA